MRQIQRARAAILVGRVGCTLALAALVGAWVTQLTGSPLLGMSQTHLFSDATVLALLGIAGLLDGLVHYRAGLDESGRGEGGIS